ncbi:MAG: MBL fold metallo-hydrolase [Proteobacteria bacterium]|jgi:glyoxylase-like metal-dependent hydrolase (beta-lactamase superfamily II)|nr:MBL fold metallo-hydrolase [Pseudomonadota bacterium]
MNDSLQLPDDVHVLERGWLSSNNIVFTTGVTAVVDTGYWTHAAQTVLLLDGLLGAQALDLVLNTHLHSDHCGGNAALAERYPDTQILIPPGQSQHVQAWDSHALTYEPTGQHCPPFQFQRLLEVGTQLQLGEHQWQVHSAPGHDPHSVILFEPEQRILVSADALWENGFGVVFPELEGQHAFAAVGATLDLIERLAPRVIIPGHGRVFTDLRSALARARNRLDGFIQNPAKHAHHAAKVLLKFKLLEIQQMTLDQLKNWAASTLYFQLVHERHFHAQQPAEWVQHLVDDLVRVGAATCIDQNVFNR